jgi:hypothetical protein
VKIDIYKETKIPLGIRGLKIKIKMEKRQKDIFNLLYIYDILVSIINFFKNKRLYSIMIQKINSLKEL